MTTVIGIRYPQVDLALLIADRQATNNNMREKHIDRRKIQTSQDGMYAFGHSGLANEDLYQLAEKMYAGKIDMQKILKEGKFPELKELNLARMGDKTPTAENSSSFLVVSRFDGKPALHTCWPLGAVEPRTLTWIGSGSKSIEDYYAALGVMMEARNYLNTQRPPTSDDLIRLGLEAVRYAQSRDLYSHGLDLIALTPNQTVDCVKDLEDDFSERIKNIQAKIKV